MVRIIPEGWYEEFEVRQMGFPEDALEEAREHEGLQSRRLKGVTWYKGAWPLAWLEKTPEVVSK